MLDVHVSYIWTQGRLGDKNIYYQKNTVGSAIEKNFSIVLFKELWKSSNI